MVFMESSFGQRMETSFVQMKRARPSEATTARYCPTVHALSSRGLPLSRLIFATRFWQDLRTMPHVFASARRWAVWMAANSLILTGCSLPYIPGVTLPPPSAGVDLRDANGRIVGSGVFLQQDDGVRVLLDVKNLPPGIKAVRIHEVVP